MNFEAKVMAAGFILVLCWKFCVSKSLRMASRRFKGRSGCCSRSSISVSSRAAIEAEAREYIHSHSQTKSQKLWLRCSRQTILQRTWVGAPRAFWIFYAAQVLLGRSSCRRADRPTATQLRARRIADSARPHHWPEARAADDDPARFDAIDALPARPFSTSSHDT